MMDQLLLHTAIGAVAIRCALNYVKKPLYAYSLCAAIVSVLVYFEVQRTQLNFYDVLGVKIGSDRQVIRTAFKAYSEAYNPQKNPEATPEEVEYFATVKKGYDTLMSETKRSNYHRFGDYNDGEVDTESGMMIMLLAIVTYVLLFVVAFLFTYPKQYHMARQTLVLYLASAFCFELNSRFVDINMKEETTPVWKDYLPFERLQLVRQLFPTALCLAMMAAAFWFDDAEATQQTLTRAILTTNGTIVAKITDVLTHVSCGSFSGGSGHSTASRKAAAEKASGLTAASKAVAKEKIQLGKKEGDATSSSDKQKNKSDEEVAWEEFMGGMQLHQRQIFGELMKVQGTAAQQQGAQGAKGKGGFGMSAFQWILLFYLGYSFVPGLFKEVMGFLSSAE
mmetsp:Transcript_20803/g.41503  ORF Transcript_20803/g.41503 Transcript_20803/m.41503 type:complete len:393 (-) Transcript_20803:402-1580(-)